MLNCLSIGKGILIAGGDNLKKNRVNISNKKSKKLAPGNEEAELKREASKEEKNESETTRVTTLSWDEVEN